MADSNFQISHIGFVVRDLERMTRFYTQALGFQQWYEGNIPPSFYKLHRLEPDMDMRVRLFSKDGFNLELVALDTPAVTPGDTRPMNAQGYAMIAMSVSALDPAIDAIEEQGGQALRDTHIREDGREIVICLDPEGNRLELMWHGAAATGAGAN